MVEEIMSPTRLCLWFAIILLPACGYQFQGETNPFHELGIRRIYIAEFRNKSFRPGLEHIFTSAMARELEKSKLFEIVDSPKNADAILSGIVNDASASVSSTSAITVRGTEQQVAAQYSADISCAVALTEPNGRVVYSHSETGSKQAPGTVLSGSDGATVALLNESEQRLAYQFLAVQMMSNTYQSMVDLF
jgi:outer membrane lipopolysaccharide assembly protein LptE/RlpB